MTFTDAQPNLPDEPTAFGPPPPDEPAPPSRTPRPALAVVASIGLVAVFLGAYVVGRDAGAESLPARKTGAATPVTTADNFEFTPSTGLTPTTEFTPSSGFSTSSGSTSNSGLFFILTNADLDGQGCNGNITFTWTFDPAKMPTAGSDSEILVTGPNSSDTYHATPAFGALKVTVPVSLDTAGEWTAVVQSVDNQTALPQPITMTLAGNCF